MIIPLDILSIQVNFLERAGLQILMESQLEKEEILGLNKDSVSGEYFYVRNEFPNSISDKTNEFQPDFILEYAHYLGNILKKRMKKYSGFY